MFKVLLDSIYLLPSFGIEVEEISKDDLIILKKLHIKNKVEFYYSELSLQEINPILIKFNNKNYNLTIESILEYQIYKRVNPSYKAIKLANKIKEKGHENRIDNLLYSIALTNNFIFLSLDSEFKEFLDKNNFNTSIFLSHKELINLLKNQFKL